ncbi:MAG TPA: alpha/beta fold hydrolase [Candidatus Elarobacter sp.]
MRGPLRRRDFTALLGAAAVAGTLPGCSSRSAGAPRFFDAPASYDAAVRAVRALIARDVADPAILPAARPRLYVHGVPVQHAVVLFHGFTNCPQQFDELARRFHARGCNVYVPRLPHHGLRDRLTRDLTNVTVDELADAATEAFALTRALGATVSALGLSLGGTMVQWLAQTQPLDLAVPIAPFLIPYPLPPVIGEPAMRVLATLPGMYFWWDYHVKEKCLPHYAYPGYPTHALARIVLFGDVIFARAETTKPLADRCVLVLNEPDGAIDNGVARKLTALWNAHGAGYRELVLPGLPGLAGAHDVIDPTTYPAGRHAVYPKLEALVLAGS